jgi:glycosyltransferase involved in cell wall biosynthesis
MNTKVESSILYQKIKILFIIDHLVGFGGTEKHLLQLVSFLNKEIFSCDVISFSAPPRIEDSLAVYKNYLRLMKKFGNQGIKIKTIPVKKLFSFSFFKQFYSIIDAIRRLRPHIVQTFHFKADTIGVLASSIAGVQNIVSSRRDMGDLKKRKHLMLNRLINPLIKKHVAVCKAVENQIQKTERIPGNKTTVIYNGLELKNCNSKDCSKNEIRAKYAIPNNAFVVGMVCVFRPEKGLDIFFRGVAGLNNKIPNLKVLAVGDGKTREEMVSFCRRKAILPDVIFAGWANKVENYISAMDVVCLTPTKNEGLSNVILEEMAMGKPVIATDVGGNSELVIEGLTGKIIPPNNPEKITKAIVELYKNPDLLKEMGENGQNRVKYCFSLSRMIKNMEEFYHSIL